MRSNVPIPGNPWPHEMAITVEDRPQALLELLWLREAYALEPVGDDLPPLLGEPPLPADPSSASSAMRAQWERSWPAIWHAAVGHAGQEIDRGVHERLTQTSNGSPERAALLAQLMGPTGRDAFGDETFADPSLRAWTQKGMDAHLDGLRDRMRVSPEHRDLDALIPAWRAGLTKIITIPCTGVFARRIGRNALLTTVQAREESESYRAALATFH